MPIHSIGGMFAGLGSMGRRVLFELRHATGFPMFKRHQILVAGSGEIAHRAVARLRGEGCSAGHLKRLDLGSLRLRSLHTLILADPTVDVVEFVEELSGICRRHRKNRPPLRLILVRCGEGASVMPVVAEGSNLTVETFDPEEQAARSLLARWPLHAGMDPLYGQSVHVLIAGHAAPAEALLVQTLRLAHHGNAQPVVTLACEDPQALREHLQVAYPQVDRFSRLRFTDINAVDLEGAPPVTGAFVCLTPAQEGLMIARQLAERIRQVQRVSPLIHLEVGDTAATGDLADWDGQLLPFSWLDDALSPRVLLDGGVDELARVIHEHYQDSIAAQGRDPAAEPAGRPWEDLGASYRDASRHQADHLSTKLAILDCRAVREDLVETFTFSPLEAERLATIEHQRWAADRYLDGWAYAPERDNARKHHPQLIPYADLSEPMKDLDRFAVRLAPTLLARSGWGLIRMLLVAVIEPGKDCPSDWRLGRLADEVLERLLIRNPDRSLVLASTLEGDASRLVVRRAVDRFEAGLFLLCPRPLSATLMAQSGAPERHDLLELAARAERRIALPGVGEPDAWFAQRAEIGLLLGAGIEAEAPVKQVLLDPGTGRANWSFEY